MSQLSVSCYGKSQCGGINRVESLLRKVDMQKIIRLVFTNDRGYRIGESHQKARLTNRLVEEIRDLHEIAGKTYPEIARLYNVHLNTVARICRYEIWNQTIMGQKKIVEYVEEEA